MFSKIESTGQGLIVGSSGQGYILIRPLNGEKNYLCIRQQLFDTCACHKLLKQHIPKRYCIARDKDEQYDVMIDLITSDN